MQTAGGGSEDLYLDVLNFITENVRSHMKIHEGLTEDLLSGPFFIKKS